MESRTILTEQKIDEKIKEINDSLPAKVIAVYQGIIRLCEADTDMTGIKVSDIAQAAGIGKGTIYDYFSTKEEIIAKALAYDIKIEKVRLQTAVFKTEGFRNKLKIGAEWIRRNAKKRFIICNLLNIGYIPAEIAGTLSAELDTGRECFEYYRYIIENIIDAGRKEGILKEAKNLIAQDTAAATSILVLIGYLWNTERYPEVTYEEVKQYAYDMLLKIFNS